MSQDDPKRFSKEWIRQNWDYERNTASKEVQLVKVVHEWHIALPGFLAALVVCSVLWLYDSPELRIILGGLGVFGPAYVAFFQKWWCSTLSGARAD